MYCPLQVSCWVTKRSPPAESQCNISNRTKGSSIGKGLRHFSSCLMQQLASSRPGDQYVPETLCLAMLRPCPYTFLAFDAGGTCKALGSEGAENWLTVEYGTFVAKPDRAGPKERETSTATLQQKVQWMSV
jgi:hypothetical protein